MSELDNCCGTTCDKEKLGEEIKALTALVSHLKNRISIINKHVVCEDNGDSWIDINDSTLCGALSGAIKDPKLCLSIDRANAVDEFIRFVSDKHGNALTLTRLRVCAQQLRDNKS